MSVNGDNRFSREKPINPRPKILRQKNNRKTNHKEEEDESRY